MRPKISVPNTAAGWRMLPKDWLYQVKLDDERATVHASGTLNRFGRPFDKTKLAKFLPAIGELYSAMRNSVDLDDVCFDVALIGYRKTRAAFKVVLLDIVNTAGNYAMRRNLWQHLPEFVGDDHNLACRLCDFTDPVLAAKAADNMGDQAEGIIGRNPRARYFQGESPDMLKLRFSP